MEIKNVLLNLRKNFHLSQSEMADRLIVTRQAVSSWENGETVPNTDTLKIISIEAALRLRKKLIHIWISRF